MKTVLVAGSRSFKFSSENGQHFFHHLRMTLYDYANKNHMLFRDLKLISGGAKGIDTYADLFATYNNLEFEEFLPDWSKGKSAALERNSIMVDKCNFAVFYWDGKSNGTADTIEKMKNAGKPYRVFQPVYEIKFNERFDG